MLCPPPPCLELTTMFHTHGLSRAENTYFIYTYILCSSTEIFTIPLFDPGAV